MLKKISLIVLCFNVFTAFSVNAETQYIHDVLRVDMRSGPTNGHRIINFLKSGTAVKVLGKSDDEEWVEVSVSGKDGWIQAQYLTPNRIAQDLLDDALATAANLKEKNRDLQQKLSNTERELNELKALQSKLDSSNNQLQTRLDELTRTSKSAIETAEKYAELQKKVIIFEGDIENLKAQNTILRDSNLEEGIKWGALSVILGAILALMIPKMTTRKKRSEW